MKKHHSSNEKTFLQRTGHAAKKHWIAASLSVFLSAITGTFIPMLEQWHSDNQVSSQIADVKSDCQREIAEVKASQALFWQQIGKNKQDVSDLKYALALKGIPVIQLDVNYRTNNQ